MLTQDILKSLLHYDVETGHFSWLCKKRYGINPGTRAGCLSNRGYIHIHVNYTHYLAHRLAWLYVHGNFPEGDLDHINRIRHDNSLCNLRLATRAQNMQHTKVRKDSKSRLKGIQQQASGRWQAVVRCNNKRYYLGTYDTPELAHHMYCIKAKELHGEFFHPG